MLKRCKRGGEGGGGVLKLEYFARQELEGFARPNTMQTCVSALKYCKVRYYVERGPSFFHGNTRTLGIPPMKTQSPVVRIGTPNSDAGTYTVVLVILYVYIYFVHKAVYYYFDVLGKDISIKHRHR
jgi:hypothetical protein